MVENIFFSRLKSVKRNKESRDESCNLERQPARKPCEGWRSSDLLLSSGDQIDEKTRGCVKGKEGRTALTDNFFFPPHTTPILLVSIQQILLLQYSFNAHMTSSKFGFCCSQFFPVPRTNTPFSNSQNWRFSQLCASVAFCLHENDEEGILEEEANRISARIHNSQSPYPSL